jgi:hypothetical protein
VAGVLPPASRRGRGDCARPQNGAVLSGLSTRLLCCGLGATLRQFSVRRIPGTGEAGGGGWTERDRGRCGVEGRARLAQNVARGGCRWGEWLAGWTKQAGWGPRCACPTGLTGPSAFRLRTVLVQLFAQVDGATFVADNPLFHFRLSQPDRFESHVVPSLDPVPVAHGRPRVRHLVTEL